MKTKLQNIHSNDGAFHDGNPATGTLGTVVTAKWLNDVQAITQDYFEEAKNILALAGIAPDSAKSNQIADAIARYVKQKTDTKVNLTGNETISGEKTFINRLKAHNGIRIGYTDSLVGQGHYAEMFADGNTTWLNFKGHTFRWHADGNFSVDGKKFFGEANKPRFTDIIEKPTTLDGYATRFNGVPYIQATSGWVGLDFGVSQGHWRLEFNPNSHNEADRRLNLFYRNGNATTYLSFPTIGTGETVAYRSWVDSRIQSLINASPSNLDTLNELAAALGNDSNFSRTVLTKIAGVETKTATAQTTANNANRNADGRVSKSGDTMTGVLEIDNAANFVRGKQGSTHKWYVGKGSSSSNDTAFYNYSYNYGIVLQADRVQLGKQPYVGDKPVHHSGLGYLSATTSNYGGINIERPDCNDKMLMESNGDQFAFIRRNRSNGQNHYAIYTPKANGTLAYQASDNTANLNTLTGSTFFKCTGDATGLPSGWEGTNDYNGIQADGGYQRFQLLVAGKDDITLRVNDSTGDSTSWSDWSNLITNNNLSKHLKSGVSRRDYSRTMNGTLQGQTGNRMQMDGNVTIYPDGRIVQILHIKALRYMWFNAEGRDTYLIPLQLWTAMPNKVLNVNVKSLRGQGNPSYAEEAAEWRVDWALRNQGSRKDRIDIHATRIRGEKNEPVDVYVVVEGY